MQLARAAIIVEPVSRVGILLGFEQYAVRTNGVNCTCVDVDHVPWLYWNPVQQFFHVLTMNRRLHFRATRSALQSKSHFGLRRGLEHIPAFGLSAGQANLPRTFVVRMYLHRKLI